MTHYHALWGNGPGEGVLHMSLVKRVLAYEPAVVLGFIAAVATAVAQEVPEGSHVSWSALVPLVLAAVVRQSVYAPASVHAVKRRARRAPVNVAGALRAEGGYSDVLYVIVVLIALVVLLKVLGVF